MAGDPSDVEARLRALEAQAARDRLELERLRAGSPQPASTASPRPALRRTEGLNVLRIAGWVLGFLGGMGVTYATVVYELHWHWAFGALLAPVGGIVVLLVIEAGGTL